MTIVIGQNLGKYVILEQLGEGGMATVYKARDTRLDRFVAIKVIRTGSERSEQFLKRFEREAKSLASLTHPNIVNIIDYGEQEGIPYLVMEFIPSGTLKQRPKEKMPWQEAVQLLLPMARALDYAHQRGIIHRDVKPANILITESGEPMLSDFGVAHILQSETAGGLTMTGMAIGTPEYMAPEQLMAAGTAEEQDERTNMLADVSRAGRPKMPHRAVDGRVDVYALGVVLFELITGRKPFMADTPIAVAVKQATEPLPLPSRLVPDLPESVEMVLLKALAKDPNARYPSMAAFAEALAGMLKQQPARQGKQKKEEVQVSAPTSLFSSPREKPEKKKFKWGWLIAVGVVIVLAAGGGALWLLLGNRGPSTAVTVFTPASSNTGGLETTIAQTLTAAPTAGATSASSPCNAAEFVADVTIPDGTVLTAGSSFTKTWRIRNTGSCSWTPDYLLKFFSGEQMGGPESVALTTGSVAPGETVDVSVALAVPGVTGTFRGDWKILSPDGDVFGTGLFVQIVADIPAGATHTREQDGMLEIYIPAGEFLMGSAATDDDAAADEFPQHTVTLSAFVIDQHEVTNAQYALCVAEGACSVPHSFSGSYARSSYYGNSAYANYPVVNVSWDQAQAYCAWAGGSLPTEAQWEKAARGTDGLIYPWGSDPEGEYGNISWRNSDTVEVCSYPDGNSPYGLCDMAGNVWEWVSDWYDADYYEGSPAQDPGGPASGSVHVIRGGSWNTSMYKYGRAAARFWDNYGWVWDYGFRCSREP